MYVCDNSKISKLNCKSNLEKCNLHVNIQLHKFQVEEQEPV